MFIIGGAVQFFFIHSETELIFSIDWVFLKKKHVSRSRNFQFYFDGHTFATYLDMLFVHPITEKTMRAAILELANREFGSEHY